MNYIQELSNRFSDVLKITIFYDGENTDINLIKENSNDELDFLDDWQEKDSLLEEIEIKQLINSCKKFFSKGIIQIDLRNKVILVTISIFE
jgi:hypothetical protein